MCNTNTNIFYIVKSFSAHPKKNSLYLYFTCEYKKPFDFHINDKKNNNKKKKYAEIDPPSKKM